LFEGTPAEAHVECHHVALAAAGETAPATMRSNDFNAQAGIVIVMKWALSLRPSIGIGANQLANVADIVGS
jgi:hypothetical protein